MITHRGREALQGDAADMLQKLRHITEHNFYLSNAEKCLASFTQPHLNALKQSYLLNSV